MASIYRIEQHRKVPGRGGTLALLVLLGCCYGFSLFGQYQPPGQTITRWATPSEVALETDTTSLLWLDQRGGSAIGDKLKKQPQKLTVFGYYRLFLYGRNMTEAYPNLAPYERTYGVGDGYREPMMSLNLTARPNGRTAFGTELFFFTPYLGTNTRATDNTFTLNLGLNFYGNFRTNIGKFGVRAGGIHWYNLSPFTVGVYQLLDRFSIFDRTPWEGVTNLGKYDNYFQSGSPNPGDLRWNNQAFQGLILDGRSLPGGLGFDMFWGKTQPNAGLANAIVDPSLTIQNPGQAGNVPTYQGFSGDKRALPSYIAGGKISKTFGSERNTLSVNTIYSHTALDSISNDNMNYQVHTLTVNWKLGKVYVEGELGGGSFESPITERKWGEALMMRVLIPKEVSVLPLDIQLYQIGKDFYNLNGAINTTSNPDIQQNFATNVNAGQVSTGGLLTQVGQLAHNRRGINLNTEATYKDFKFNFGWGLAGELEVQNSDISFVHRINGLALSRIYNPFPENATSATVFGPYNRQFSFFRGVSERVRTTDLDPATAAPLTKKYYNSVDFQAKYKTKLDEKAFYVFYLGNLMAAKSEATLWPTLSPESYLFVQYHELDIYYELFPKFLLTSYLGLERTQGGRFTEWGENDLPRDQTGLAIGGGFDWTLNDATGLYFRYRHMDFEDKNFELDKYKGHEITIELKTFF
ncbi:MAG: hypothetical protein ACRBG0_20815 [Lewinella sp.]|uniref:hypothetical protein n=1 Tax=Lewinella sp. TaxID=2004506 RepID=UPI003D6B68CE